MFDTIRRYGHVMFKKCIKFYCDLRAIIIINALWNSMAFNVKNVLINSYECSAWNPQTKNNLKRNKNFRRMSAHEYQYTTKILFTCTEFLAALNTILLNYTS